MIKTYSLIAALTALPLMGMAQTVDSVISVEVDVNIDYNESEISGDMTTFLNGFMASVKDIAARQASGELSEDAANAERKALDEDFETKAEALAKSMVASIATLKGEGEGSHRIVIKKQIILSNEEDASVCVDDKADVSEVSDENDGLSVSVGGMVFMQRMESMRDGFVPLTSGDWAMSPRQAKRMEVSFRNQDRIGKSSFWLRRGISLSAYVMDFGPDRYLALTEGAYPGVAVMQSDQELMVSNFSVGYLELPLALVYNGSASGSKGLSLAVGGFAGVRVGAETKIMRRSDAGRMTQTTQHGFYTSRLAFGTQMEIGYKKFFLASRMNLNPFFQQRRGVSTPSIAAATMSLGIHL